MTALNLTEQEQLSQFKTWWSQYGRFVIAFLTATILGVGSYLVWTNYQHRQSGEASVIFANLQRAVVEHDIKRIREAAGELVAHYPRTAYAELGALIAAKAHYTAGDAKTAKTELDWAVQHGRNQEVRELARLRLVFILFDEKAFEEALKQISMNHASGILALQLGEIKGDILLAQAKLPEAKSAYQEALNKLSKEEKELAKPATGTSPTQSATARERIQLKMTSLGLGDK